MVIVIFLYSACKIHYNKYTQYYCFVQENVIGAGYQILQKNGYRWAGRSWKMIYLTTNAFVKTLPPSVNNFTK